MEETPGGSFNPGELSATQGIRFYRSNGDHWRRYLFASTFVKGQRVLDFGCGYGFGSYLLAPSAREYVGTDRDSTALAWARKNFGNEQGNAKFIPPDSPELEVLAPFDVVVSFEVVEHLGNPRQHFSYLAQTVGDGGTVILSTPNGLLSQHASELFHSPFHQDEYSISELSSMIDRSVWEPTFFRMYRLDRTEVLVDRLKRAALKKWPSALSLKSNQLDCNSRTSNIFPSWASRVYFQHLNGPRLWRITRSSFDQMQNSSFSDIVVVLRKIRQAEGLGLKNSGTIAESRNPEQRLSGR